MNILSQHNFIPKLDAAGMKIYLAKEDKKKEVVSEHGIDKYNEMLERLDDPDKIAHTQNTIIPNFLDQAGVEFARGLVGVVVVVVMVRI